MQNQSKLTKLQRIQLVEDYVRENLQAINNKYGVNDVDMRQVEEFRPDLVGLLLDQADLYSFDESAIVITPEGAIFEVVDLDPIDETVELFSRATGEYQTKEFNADWIIFNIDTYTLDEVTYEYACHMESGEFLGDEDE